MKFSIIIPVAKKDTRFVKRCLLSLQDQDLGDFEAIIVTDGFNYELPITDNRFKLFSTESKSGASIVRNYGASKATGDYLFFFDADCTLFPGMLQLISDTFDKYPDIDFCYSGYRFNHSTLSVFPSRPFDPYLIQSMNYICTMSPMKRHVFETVGGFRENLEFFQDWDFFIRAIKDHNFKGKYLKDYLFSTEVPNATSISGSPKHSFRDKLLKIESLNNIDSRDVCVTTLSAPYQSIERAKILNARYIGAHPGSSLTQLPSQFDFGSKVIIMQGFFPQAVNDHMSAFTKDSINVINWIGTDVWQLRNKFNFESIKIIKESYLSKIDLQLCNSYELQSELKEIGIDAKVVFQPLTERVTQSKLPSKPTVSAYCSSGHPLHNEYYIKDLAKSMPDVNFILFGTALKDVRDGNIRYMGFIPIQDAINLSTIHIRLTQHDGFPHTPIYFSMAGRRVICNFPLKYVDYFDQTPNENNWGSLKKDIVNYIYSNINSPINYNVKECQDYYLDLCCPYKYKEKMNYYINQLKESKNAKSNLCASNV